MSIRKITVKSGNEEFTLEVTEEEYLKYYRPWWQQKKHEQRNREAMEQNGYTEESYEEWKENDMRTELFAESMTALKNIIDTWNMIEKYGIEGYEVLDSMAVAVPDSEYERLLNSVKNKRYIQNLRRSSEWLAQRGYH